jgi:hypothetical protein
MGFRLPTALAGDDNEVELNEDGARTVIELVTGTALGAVILGAGFYLYQRLTSLAGSGDPMGDLY